MTISRVLKSHPVRLVALSGALAALAGHTHQAGAATLSQAQDLGTGWAQNILVDDADGSTQLDGAPYQILAPVQLVLGPAAPRSIEQRIRERAAAWGLPPERLVAIARCESGFQPLALNRSSNASGLFQFLPSTWVHTPQGRAGLSVFDPDANIEGAMWLYATYGPTQWECYALGRA